jgi:hypothetical protein
MKFKWVVGLTGWAGGYDVLRVTPVDERTEKGS